MTVRRGRWAALALVVGLVAAALVAGLHRGGGGRAAASTALSPALQRARVAAHLPACPAGLGVGARGLRLSCMAGGPDVAAAAAPGRPMLVNLWGTWCGPCVREVPTLVRFAALAGDRVGVVGVATEDTPASVYAFATAFGLNYPQVRDDEGDLLHAFASYGQGVPKTVLVTADGRVASVQLTPFTSLAQVEDAVALHLGVRL